MVKLSKKRYQGDTLFVLPEEFDDYRTIVEAIRDENTRLEANHRNESKRIIAQMNEQESKWNEADRQELALFLFLQARQNIHTELESSIKEIDVRARKEVTDFRDRGKTVLLELLSNAEQSSSSVPIENDLVRISLMDEAALLVINYFTLASPKEIVDFPAHHLSQVEAQTWMIRALHRAARLHTRNRKKMTSSVAMRRTVWKQIMELINRINATFDSTSTPLAIAIEEHIKTIGGSLPWHPDPELQSEMRKLTKAIWLFSVGIESKEFIALGNSLKDNFARREFFEALLEAMHSNLGTRGKFTEKDNRYLEANINRINDHSDSQGRCQALDDIRSDVRSDGGETAQGILHNIAYELRHVFRANNDDCSDWLKECIADGSVCEKAEERGCNSDTPFVYLTQIFDAIEQTDVQDAWTKIMQVMSKCFWFQQGEVGRLPDPFRIDMLVAKINVMTAGGYS